MNTSFYQTLCRLIGAVALATVAMTHSLLAQQPAAPSNDKPYEQLYEKATVAETISELNQLIQEMKKLQGQEAAADMKSYVTELLAWTLNRRGETYTKQAAEKAEQNDEEAALKLDRLALKDFEQSIELDPQRWKSLHNRGVCYALNGQFTDALKDFSRVIELRKDYANAWFNRGEIHYELGHFERAVTDYDQAIKLAPTDGSMYTARGHANFQLRRFQQALDDYTQVVKLAPNHANAFADRGDAYRSLGRWEEAAHDFRKAIQLDKRLPHAFQSAAWLMATCPDQRFRNPDLAVKTAQKAVELRGEGDYIYLDTLAAAYADHGEFKKAEDTLRRAIELAPQENVKPLKQRLELYQAQKPFRQTVVKELR